MDCAHAAEVIEQFRLGDHTVTSSVLQRAVDHIHNCGCESCTVIKRTLNDEGIPVSIGQG